MVNIGSIIGVCGVLACAGTAAFAQIAVAPAQVDELEAPAIGAPPVIAVPVSVRPVSVVDEVISRDDPFSLDGLTEVLPKGDAPLVMGFRPAATLPVKLPSMVLRGIGRMNGDDMPTALLDIKGHGLFIVTENETISLQGISNDNVLRIVEINEISVTVEAGSFGELIVVR